jgi:hypothetical protein
LFPLVKRSSGALTRFRTPLRADWLAFGAIAACQVFLIFTHSPWFDEEHALLIARAPWADLLGNLKYEGHPTLWYVWLGAIDRLLGASPLALPVAQLPITLGLLWLIWFRSPFPFAAKVLLSLSYFFAFEYGVISRSYGLGVLLLLTAVPLRRSAGGWVCLALAANTAVHCLLAAGALGAAFFIARRDWKGPAILAFGFAVAALTTLPPAPDLYPTSALLGDAFSRSFNALRIMSTVLIPAVPHWPPKWGNVLPILPGAAVGAGTLVLAVVSLRRAPAYAAGFVALAVALAALSMQIYELSPRHVGVLFAVLVAGWWVIAESRTTLSRLAWAWLGVSVVCALPFLTTPEPFTRHRQIAKWIRTYKLEGESWGAWPGREGDAISAQFGRPLVNLEKDCLNTFVRWDYPHDKITDPLRHIRSSGVHYVISAQPLPDGQLLAQFAQGVGWGPPLWLYRFDQTPSPLTTCRSSAASGCTYSVSTSDLGVGASGGTSRIEVHTDMSCSWNIAGLPTWLTLSGSPHGTGSAVITLLAARNPGGARAASVAIGGVAVPIRQFNSSSCGVGPCVTWALPHIAFGGEWTTSLFAVNPWAQTANFAVSFYADSGSTMTLPFAGGFGNVSTLTDTVPAHGRKDYQVGKPSSLVQSGWGLVIADKSITTQLMFRRATSNGNFYEAAVPSGGGYSSFIVPFDATSFQPTGGLLYTGFALANLHPDAVAHVTCTARDEWGATIPDALIILAVNPLGHYANYAFPALTGKRGTLDCRADTLVSAMALRLIGTDAFSTLPVIVR